MNIGILLKGNCGSLNNKHGNVIGDELLGISLCNAINRIAPDCHAELYALNHRPKEKLDVMIHLNDTPPDDTLARKNVLYLQNGGFGAAAETILTNLVQYGYDSYVFFSGKLLEIHQKMGNNNGIFLPFGVDTTLFRPCEPQAKYRHEVAYVGNDIKGEVPSMKFLYPAVNFDFGLYGNWEIGYPRFRFWKRWAKTAPYKKAFAKLSRGKIPQEDVPALYSSAKINLNCTLTDCIEWDVITLRTYEVLACKGFLISDTVPLAKATMSGCLVFTEGGEMLKDQIRYYLDHNKERNEIIQNGYEYVIKHASVEERAKELLNHLGSIFS